MTLNIHSDEHYMREALKEAKRGYEAGEIPVGAIIVSQHKIIARAHNQTEQLTDVTAHAEMIAITAASHYLGGKYLSDCTLYVTLEPCMMCIGALYWAQIGRIVFGASDNKRGFELVKDFKVHPKTQLQRGVLANESEVLLKEFFQKLRK
ncbi:MAG: nucleoside deaminase [Cytophagaceae bacterium]|jgi:tRNA(adenine34) deaminase|nr:nucleoside deaminase [Cytophagaceae bacterium]